MQYSYAINESKQQLDLKPVDAAQPAIKFRYDLRKDTLLLKHPGNGTSSQLQLHQYDESNFRLMK
ncbi:MAG: hypothetical protein FH748_10745 [Balneolaceae bacterium]|nr:hypothetical protein [Balneolaceae bacterium]